MIRYTFVPAFLLGCLMVGCSNPRETDKSVTIHKEGKDVFYEIHLQDIKDPKETELVDLVKNFEFVALETNDDCLFERGKFLITREYILVQRRSYGILQFDRTGKFIRNLVKVGAGPREYRYAGWVVNEDTQILYLADRHKENYLMQFQLSSGEYLGDLKKAIPIECSEVFLTERNNLFLVPVGVFNLGTKPFYAYEQNYFGEKIAEVAAPDGWTNRYVENIGLKFGKTIWYQDKENESLCQIKRDQLIPFLTIDFGQKRPGSGLVGDKRFDFDFAIGEQIYFNIFTVTDTQLDGESFISYGETENYFFDPKEGKAYLHKELYLNPTHHSVDANDRELTVQSNGMIYYVYSAIDLITQAKKAFSDDDFKEPYRSQLEQIIATISEESNPVILLGPRSISG